MERQPGTKLIKEFGEGEWVVDMIQFRDRVYVATNRRVFRTDASGEKLIELSIVEDVE